MPQTAEQIQVACTCGKKLKAPASAVGKKAKCPGCGSVLTIKPPATAAAAAPAPAKAKPKPKPVEAEEEVGLGALYELAAAEKKARVEDRPRCPQCVNEVEPTAVICTNCGFNLKTGKALQTQTIAANAPKKSGAGGGFFGKKKASTSPSGKPVEDAMAPQGSFAMGVGGSAIGGAIGGVVWFLIAWFTGFEVGFIALGVGALAGVGMQAGQKGYSKMGGVVAAGVAFLAIALAKVAVIAAVVMPHMGDDEEGVGSSHHDDRIIHLVANDIAKTKGTTLEDMSYDDEEKAYKEANKRLDKMPPQEIQALTARADDNDAKEELAHMVAEEMHQQAGGGDVDLKKYVAISAAAEKKVEAMTPAQRASEKARLEAKFAKELAANKAAEKDDENDRSSDSGSSAGKTAAVAGIALLLLLVIGWKSILFLVIAMSLAYKTAAGSVSG